MGIELRPYQKECIKTVDELPDGSRTIVCLATGMGKTLTASNFNSRGRILWLSHRDELVRQPEKYFKLNGKTYGIEKGKERAQNEDVVSASVQTLSRDTRLKKYRPDDFDIIICDEAQHAAAPTYRKILGYFRPRKLIGLTATPKRGDGVRLTDVFDNICFTRDLKWGIKNGYLSRIRAVRISASVDFKNIKTSMGDLMVSSMSDALLKSDDDIIVANAYKEYSLPEHKKTLIYCPTIKVCEKVYKTIQEGLSDIEKNKIAILSEKNTAEERKNILDKYATTDSINCIINCMLLTEGTDLPSTSVIINNRPTANTSLYQQIIGRGTRLYKDKEYCLVIDIVGKHSSERNICTAPTLFGLQPEFLPKIIQDELEKDDLLTVAEDILGQNMQSQVAIKLKKELIDIFTGKRIAIIQNNKAQGYQSIANEYENITKPDKDDFGDLVVKLQPEEEKYYCIPATYNGNIYISKPDLLEKCVVTIDIPAQETIDHTAWRGVSKPMPYNIAKDVVKDILRYSISEDYMFRWSKSARIAMDKTKATEKQCQYIETLYRKEHVDKGLSKLTKLQASNLIELYKEIEQLKSKRDQIKAGKDDNIQKHLTKLELNDNYKKIILDTAKRRRTQLEEIEAFVSAHAEGDIKIKINPETKGMSKYRVTKKQKTYIISLKEQLEENNKQINIDPETLEVNMWEASIVIECLKNAGCLPKPPGDNKYEIDLANLMTELKTIQKEYEILCHYKLLKYGIAMEFI